MVTSMTRRSRTERTRLHSELALRECLAGVDCAPHEHAERVGFQHQREKRFAARLIDARGKQILSGDVGVHHAQVRIEDHDAGGERTDEIGGLEMRDR
jgi:hypothetical protein